MHLTKIGTRVVFLMATALASAVVVAPASAKDSKKTGAKPAAHSSAAAAAQEVAGAPDTASAATTAPMDRKSGPAWRTIGGTVTQIKGDMFMVEDYEGNQIRLFVGSDTKHLRAKKVGDPVRAEITRDGFANSIQ
jgi:uncharacterized membrane protein